MTCLSPFSIQMSPHSYAHCSSSEFLERKVGWLKLLAVYLAFWWALVETTGTAPGALVVTRTSINANNMISTTQLFACIICTITLSHTAGVDCIALPYTLFTLGSRHITALIERSKTILCCIIINEVNFKCCTGRDEGQYRRSHFLDTVVQIEVYDLIAANIWTFLIISFL